MIVGELVDRQKSRWERHDGSISYSRGRHRGAPPKEHQRYQESSVEYRSTSVASPVGSIRWRTKVRRWIGRLLVVMIAAISVGCVGPETMGDRAMERGDPYEALAQYEAAIEQGDQDPELYYRAAQAAQQQGAFAKAERYYSQSLRYGGGEEIAQSLAEFYIQTSNYGQAVNVLEYLARIEPDDDAVQRVYSDMGTALMYDGDYVDAESYLLLAQELEPADPVPYINLGVLYDRHLRNKPKAVRFYECFTELGRDQGQVRQVHNRLREIESRRAVDTSRVELECGEEYRVTPAQEEDLGEMFSTVDEVDDAGVEPRVRRQSDDSLVVITDNLDLDYTPSASSEDEDLERGDGESGGDDLQLEVVERSVGNVDESPTNDEEADRLQRATDSYEAGRYDQAVERFEDLADRRKLDPEDRRRMGTAYYRIGDYERSVEVLEEIVDERPSPPVVGRLIDAYRRLGDDEGVGALCDRFASWPDYEDEVRDCDEVGGS